MATIKEIYERASAIKNETEVGANTAERVGGVIYDIASKLDSKDTEIDERVERSLSGVDSATTSFNKYIIEAKQNEQGRVDAEGDRAKAEAARNKAEKERVGEEDVRVESEKKRVSAEQSRVDAEALRAKAEEARVLAEKKRESNFADVKSACEEATDNASTAAANTKEAIKKCETATSGAEKCNVQLVGSEISVTDRNGETKSIDVIGPGENVVVYITSSVEGLSVVGLKINVYLNNGKTPQTYTTDSEGVAKFEVDRGNYYEVAFPEFGNAQPITPVGFTSVLGARDIRVEYKPYSMDETEEATVSVMKYDEGNGTAFAGAKVSVTIGGETNEYTADEYGKVFVYVPYGKDYTVTVKDQDAYFVRYAKNSRTYTAKLPKRSIVYTMYQYKTGILVVDDSLNEYYIDDWLADDKSPDDAVAIRVAEQQLLLNGGSFLFRVSDLKNLSKLPTRQWCTQNIQFNSIALNGNSVKDENYYRGETSTFLIRQEAEERSLSVPAFDYAWNQELVIGNQHLRGFIMSVGQEYIHIANRVEIGEVLRKLFDDEIADTYLAYVTSKNRWTSTQTNATNAWLCNSQANNNYKGSSYYVLPVFAC